MKRLLPFLSFLLALGAGACYRCENVDCGLHGTCRGGTCECETGYEGEFCQFEICASVDCGFNGNCDPATGSCLCNRGYEGGACETRQTTKFTGAFAASENCTLGPFTYTCTIAESATTAWQIDFSNLYDAGISTRAEVQENGTDFLIPSQSFGLGTLHGSGTISSDHDQVIVDYTIVIASDSDRCQLTLQRL